MAYTKAGAETRVNVAGAGSQISPFVATLANGRYAITWASPEAGGSARARIFDADGAPASGDIVLATAGASNAIGVSSIDALPGGGFAVGYYETNTQVVRVRVVGANGVAGADFVVDPDVSSTQFEPQVLGLANGTIAVAWQRFDRTLNDFDYGTSLRIFAADGTPLTGNIQVNVRLDGYQTGARPALLANGDIVVAWSDYNTAADGSQNAARARIFAPDGTPKTGEIVVNTTTTGSQTVRDVTPLPDGGFVVHYENTQRGGAGPIGSFVQAFDATGAKVGPEVGLAGLGGSFTRLADGSFVHTYSADALQPEVYLQRYTAAFAADGPSEYANTAIPGVQAGSDVAALSTGFVVTYFTSDTSVDGDGRAILMQRYGGASGTGTRGDDVLVAPSDAPWRVSAGAGDDTVTGAAGDDVIGGGAGNDTIRGGRGSDRLLGGDGDDTIHGGAERDLLSGGAGNDRLVSGAGPDVMIGGADADTFVFTAADLANAARLLDARITDFARGEGDRIDLSAIDAVAGGGDDAFAVIGAAAFWRTAGELRIVTEGTITRLYGDTDGDGRADLVIRVDGAAPPVAADLIL